MSLTLELDDYEHANLLNLWRALGHSPTIPFSGADTGDWFGQIGHRLASVEPGTKPNVKPEEARMQMERTFHYHTTGRWRP